MPYRDPLRQKAYFQKYDKIRSKRPRRRKQLRKASMKFSKNHPDERWIMKGFKLKDKKKLYKKQRGRCAACGKKLPVDFYKIHTDHAHGTAIVRGLTHWYCNIIIGHEENHPGILKKILRYIKKWRVE